MPGGFLYHVELWDKNLAPGHEVPRDIIEWCESYIGIQEIDWDYVGGFYPTNWGFNNSEDAMAFKLRWLE